MKRRFHRITAFLLSLLFLISCSATAAAAESKDEEEQVQWAEEISDFRAVEAWEGLHGFTFFDKSTFMGGESWGEPWITLSYHKCIGSVYIIFQYVYGEYEVVNNDTGEVAVVGQKGYLHDFLDMEQIFGECPASVTLRFPNGKVYLNELRIFTPGRVPDSVQIWEEPKDGETDLVLFSAHADDEHLFFAGVLPYYGKERGYQVQVVYLTGHPNYSTQRIHELLNGLWAVGIRSYPVIGRFSDFRYNSLLETYVNYASMGEPREEMLGFIVEQMRRFHPQVVVTHDFKGEYGHGMHMAMADLVAEALETSNDPSLYPETAEKYGTWDVPKAYFHLYGKNQIQMDWDQPLESFGGRTAYQVSVYTGFQAHASQLKDYRWYYAGYPTAKSIELYNPCLYGLYRSTVGEDVLKNDFFENVHTHAELAVMEAERLAEEARLKAEEEARLAEEAAQRAAEEARLKAEAEAREAQLAKERAEAEALEARQKAEALRKKRMTTGLGAGGGVVILAVCVWIFRKKAKRKNI